MLVAAADALALDIHTNDVFEHKSLSWSDCDIDWLVCIKTV